MSDASKIFGVKETKLYDNLNRDNLENLYDSIKYLFHETTVYTEFNRRGIFKDSIYIRRLRRILTNPNKEERRAKLDAFVTDLKGPSIRFVLEKVPPVIKYTIEEKEKILKYRLKFAISGLKLERDYHIDKDSLARWEKELPNSELKERLRILREYKTIRYYSHIRNKK